MTDVWIGPLGAFVDEDDIRLTFTGPSVTVTPRIMSADFTADITAGVAAAVGAAQQTHTTWILVPDAVNPSSTGAAYAATTTVATRPGTGAIAAAVGTARQPTITVTGGPTPPYGTFFQPFASTSVWNRPLNASPTYQTSGTHPWVQAPATSGYQAGYNQSPEWGHPFYLAAESDFGVRLRTQNYENWALYGPIGQDYTEIFPFKVPAGATPATGPGWTPDAHMHVLWGNRLMEMYGAYWNQGNLDSGYMVEQSITGDGLQGGPRAYGGAAVAGMVRKWELDAGVIQHRLALMLPTSCMSETNGPAWVWPANRKDDGAYSNPAWGARMGQCYAIPKNVNINTLGLGATALIVAKALQDYGGHIVDTVQEPNISVFDIECEGVYSMTGYGAGTDCAKIAAQLRLVPNVTAGNPGG